MDDNLKYGRTLFQKIKDFLFFPVRILFEHETVEKLGLTSFRSERFRACLPFVKGNVLDIGCGKGNEFIRMIKKGIGLDFNPWPGVDVVASAEQMPFDDKMFDTVTMMVSFRYIKNREVAMREIKRVLKDDGLLLILENCPFVNRLRLVLIRWWNPYKNMYEKNDLTKKNMKKIIEQNDLKLTKIVRYIYGFGRLYVISR